MAPELLELIAQFMQVLRGLEEWLADAPRQESWPARWLAPLLPALLGGAVGAGFVALLTSRVQRGLIDHQERIRAFDEVLSPLLETLHAVYPVVLATGGYARGATVRFVGVEPHWRDVHRLLRHPLHIYLPQTVLEPVKQWDAAETRLQTIWEDGAHTGSPGERAAFVLLVSDSSLSPEGLQGLPDRAIDRATHATYASPSDEVVRRARDSLRADPTMLDQKRPDAEEWHRTRRRTAELIKEATSVLAKTIGEGPGSVANRSGLLDRLWAVRVWR